MPLTIINIFQPRGQCIILLFATLREMGGSVTKQMAIQYIGDHHWFALELEDHEPYQSQRHTGEARWKTLIAWARKDSALRDLMLYHERDSWSLSRTGISKWDLLRAKFKSGELTVGDGYLWSVAFKRYLYPKYEPSPNNKKRPARFYEDRVNLNQLLIELGL